MSKHADELSQQRLARLIWNIFDMSKICALNMYKEIREIKRKLKTQSKEIDIRVFQRFYWQRIISQHYRKICWSAHNIFVIRYGKKPQHENGKYKYKRIELKHLLKQLKQYISIRFWN